MHHCTGNSFIAAWHSYQEYNQHHHTAIILQYTSMIGQLRKSGVELNLPQGCPRSDVGSCRAEHIRKHTLHKAELKYW
jgi:hypothetical protein